MRSLKLFIIKDWIVIRKYLWVVLLYLCFLTVSGSSSFLVTIIPAMMLIIVSNVDLRPFHKYLTSLPVSRKGMILGKYVSSGVYMTGGVILAVLFYLGGSFIRGTNAGEITVQAIVPTLLLLVMFMALYYPLYYWLGPKGGQYLNFIWMIVLGGSIGISSMFSVDEGGATPSELFLNSGAGLTLVLGLAGLFVILSYLLSVAIFLRKDI
ncbi:ABC-2 transporter permease [Paenibacillus sp. N3/727]|uniref:ABC-2 transporter permease n=1 Tax=Paenibacillus sp. N3/727 TaxID=2925845 RepID=UPI001F52E189|nr:ABC-2 transporter permease [Paenibacillus sp. N3/727]UNK16586.1 ABC-2 transporter permease [Paenibacillus sp. N3/727]